MSQLISIVVPVLNREKEVRRTLDSILRTAYRPLQLLVVDNGSTDSTLEVCCQWAEHWRNESGVRVEVLCEAKPGANAARNLGLRRAEGKYVVFFDSDDEFCPESLSDVGNAVENDEPDWLFLPVAQGTEGRMRVRAYLESSAPHVHLLNSMMLTSSMVLRTDWLRSLGGWDEALSIWQDWELGTRVLLRGGRCRWLTGRVYHKILLHADSITGESLGQRWQSTLATMHKVLKDIMSAENIGAERQRCLRALYFRAMIVGGKLRREGVMEGFEAYRNLAAEVIPHAAKSLRLWGLFLSAYSAAGGRGAWRVALKIVG